MIINRQITQKSEIWRDMMKKQMKIEEAILYCLASQNRGMRTKQIAEMINRQRLHIRKDGNLLRPIRYMR